MCTLCNLRYFDLELPLNSSNFNHSTMIASSTLSGKRLYPPGKPDIVLPKYKTIIFVNGCFWHGHNCKKGKLPSSNTDFWKEKISNNKSRDAKNSDLLVKLGWKVIIIWQCEISKIDNRTKILNKLLENIKQ